MMNRGPGGFTEYFRASLVLYSASRISESVRSRSSAMPSVSRSSSCRCLGEVEAMLEAQISRRRDVCVFVCVYWASSGGGGGDTAATPMEVIGWLSISS